MKKVLSWILVLAMLLTCASAMADHMTLTINSTHSNSTMDYNSDGMYKLISEMFDFDYDVWPVSKDAQSEKIRTWINGGAMPDLLTWRDFKYQEYVSYAEMGMLGALPSGWEEKYPDLYSMFVATGIAEQMYVDGDCYGIPHATFARFGGMPTVVNHLNVYYRKDWAQKLGIEIGDTITLDQLAAYIRACIDNDMAGNGNTLGLTNDPEYVANFFMLQADMAHDKFYKGENSYVWGYTQPQVLEAIKLANSWYKQGLINPDFYLNTSSDAVNNFTSGIAACMYHNCAISSYMGYRTTFLESTGMDPEDCVGVTVIANNEGTTRAIQQGNYWSCTMFSPDLDDAKWDRILSIMNWICTEEGQMTVLLGVRGEAWDYDENHAVKMLTTPNENGKYPSTVDLYPSYNVFRSLGILPDDYSFINPSNDPSVVAQVRKTYDTKQTGNIIPLDYDYEFFASDNKANYSLDLKTEIARMIMLPEADLETEWNGYIDTNKTLWQPVIDDLNAVFFK